ncbi:unnamed protein product [Cunninghamella echinulata]
MYKSTKEKYSQMVAICERLLKDMSNNNFSISYFTNYYYLSIFYYFSLPIDAEFDNFIIQSDNISEKTQEIEEVAKELDQYSKHLGNISTKRGRKELQKKIML